MEVVVKIVTQLAMDVMEQETLTVMLVLTKETIQWFVVHQENTTTALFVKPAQVTSTLTEVAVKAVIRVVVDALEGRTQSVLLVPTKEIPQTNVVHQDSTTTTLLVKLVQLMSTLTELTV